MEEHKKETEEQVETEDKDEETIVTKGKQKELLQKELIELTTKEEESTMVVPDTSQMHKEIPRMPLQPLEDTLEEDLIMEEDLAMERDLIMEKDLSLTEMVTRIRKVNRKQIEHRQETLKDLGDLNARSAGKMVIKISFGVPSFLTIYLLGAVV